MIPPKISRFGRLRKLDLSSNNLRDVALELFSLPFLTSLNLNNNPELDALPPCIAQMHNLTDLSIRSTGVTELPWEVGKLTALLRLQLDSDAFTRPPVAFLRKNDDAREIVRYLRRLAPAKRN